MSPTGLVRPHATFTPALQDNYARIVAKPDQAFRGRNLPAGLPSLAALNFLDPTSPLLFHDHVLFSVAPYLAAGRIRRNMLSAADRQAVTIYADSGGFQVISGLINPYDPVVRHTVLLLQETYADVGVILDTPSRSVASPKSGFTTVQACLDATADAADFFRRHRTPGRIKLLNVMQGDTPADADAWWARMSGFHFDGWAFGGHLRLKFDELCRRLIVMRDTARLGGHEGLIHILGTARIDVACVLDVIQEELRRTVDESIKITFDAATPFKIAGVYQGHGDATLSKAGFSIPSGQLPRDRARIGSTTPFPFRTSLGRRLTVGDLCVVDSVATSIAWDEVSWAMASHHNLNALLDGYQAARLILQQPTADAQEFAPLNLLQCIDAVRDVLRSETPLSVIRRRRAELQYV